MSFCQFVYGIYIKITNHVDEATIDLCHSILKAGNNSKLLLCVEDEVGSDFYFNQMSDVVKIKQAAKGSAYNSTGP